MATFQIKYCAVEITDHGFTWSPLDAPLATDIRHDYNLKDIKRAVAAMLTYYEAQGMEVLAMTRITEGRAPVGYRAWESGPAKLTGRALKQAA